MLAAVGTYAVICKENHLPSSPTLLPLPFTDSPNPHFPKRYISWMNAVLDFEIVAYEQLGFHLYVDHPHRYILAYINTLNGSSELAQRAWNFINDS